MEQAQEQKDRKDQKLEPVDHRLKIPPLPSWPTSKPGPTTTEPPPGMRRMHLRTEQVVEVGYDQERGEPSILSPARTLPDQSLKEKTSFDQSETAQEAERRRERKKK